MKETVGEYLKREREARRVALDEIAKGTRISLPFLEALEKNDFQAFRRQEFIQGFLQGYARYIGIDPEQVLERYRFQVDRARLKQNFQQLPLFKSPGEPADKPGEPRSEPPPVRRRDWKGSYRLILLQAAVTLAALGLSFYIYLSLRGLEDEGSLGGKKGVFSGAIRNEERAAKDPGAKRESSKK